MAFLNQQKSSQLARCPGHISLAFCRVCKLLWIFFSLFFLTRFLGGTNSSVIHSHSPIPYVSHSFSLILFLHPSQRTTPRVTASRSVTKRHRVPGAAATAGCPTTDTAKRPSPVMPPQPSPSRRCSKIAANNETPKLAINPNEATVLNRVAGEAEHR